jgi:hypothetical protein
MIDFQRLKFTCCYAFQFEQFKIRIKWRSRISILRSNEERENDIGAVENNIIRWRNEIAQLEKEMSLLYLELKKIHWPLLLINSGNKL